AAPRVRSPQCRAAAHPAAGGGPPWADALCGAAAGAGAAPTRFGPSRSRTWTDRGGDGRARGGQVAAVLRVQAHLPQWLSAARSLLRLVWQGFAVSAAD